MTRGGRNNPFCCVYDTNMQALLLAIRDDVKKSGKDIRIQTVLVQWLTQYQLTIAAQ